jgi:DNA-binding transcriptional LysR family regulator
MRLRHIEVIQALLQTGHLGTAAEWLQLPVTEVERILREAEDQVGFMLFSSVRGRLQATREARELQVEIAHVYEALEPVQRLANSLRQYLAPPLRIICTPPLAQQLLPQSIAALRRRLPDAPCTLLSQPTRDIVRSLLLRESDLGLSLHDPDRAEIHCHDPLSPALEHKLHALRPAPVIQTRVQTHQMMRSMVEAGEGLAIVDPFTALGAKSAGLDVCPLAPAVPVSVYALTLKNGEPSPAVQALLDIITEQAAAMLGS